MKKFNPRSRITVLGGGSWATAIVKLLQENVFSLSWYMRNFSSIEYIRQYRHNPRYLTDVDIDIHKVKLCDNINQAVRQSDVIILAIPAAFLPEALNGLNEKLSEKFIVSAIKGMIPEHDLIVADYLHSVHAVPYEQMAVIAGPCHAEEVALERLSYLTIASKNQELANFVAGNIKCHYLNTFLSEDLLGTEYAAVLKNIFALASGICHGLGYGDNFQAVLISNAIREMKRFADAIHPIERDIKDTAYLGDLLVTAYSKFSRNRNFGLMIGKGYSVNAARLELNMVAEGYYAIKSIHHIRTRYTIDLPIIDAVYSILYEGIPAKIEIKRLTALLT